MSRRLVSLPFSDHCDPLVDRPDDLSEMIEFLRREVEERRYRSFELRPRRPLVGRPMESCVGRPSGPCVGRPFRVAESATYCLHTLDLSRPASEIFSGFHHSSTQRAIRRAEREGLVYEAGTSERLLSSFYGLLRLTRRRHGLPPQPLAWFRNLVDCMRDAHSTRFARSGQALAIHLASKDGQPIASILTLSFKKTMVYKYGGSDWLRTTGWAACRFCSGAQSRRRRRRGSRNWTWAARTSISQGSSPSRTTSARRGPR